MVANTIVHAAPPALPAADDLAAHRVMKFNRLFNDEVEEAFKALWPNPDFRKLLYAVWNSQAVEGHLVADDMKAADMIRTWAQRAQANGAVAQANIWTIVLALRVVMKRYDLSRSKRRQTVDGEIVPDATADE